MAPRASRPWAEMTVPALEWTLDSRRGTRGRWSEKEGQAGGEGVNQLARKVKRLVYDRTWERGPMNRQMRKQSCLSRSSWIRGPAEIAVLHWGCLRIIDFEGSIKILKTFSKYNHHVIYMHMEVDYTYIIYMNIYNMDMNMLHIYDIGIERECV